MVSARRSIARLQSLRGLHFIEACDAAPHMCARVTLQSLRGLHFIEAPCMPAPSTPPPCYSPSGDCTSLRRVGC